MNLSNLIVEAKKNRKSTKKYFAKLSKRPPKELDEVMQELHNEVFKEIDCLTCANSPLFTDKDIDRIAHHLKLKPGQFTDKFLHIDADGDYVLKSAPCTFLDQDNYCSIYEVRPKACAEYPHTNRKRFHQLLPLTLKNTEICPATLEIVERLKKALPI